MARLSGPAAQFLAAAVVVGAIGAGVIVVNAARTAPSTEPGTAAGPYLELVAPIEGRDNFWGRVAIYPVIEDGTLAPVAGGTRGEIWAAFTRIVTPEFSADHMSALLIANDPGNPVIAAVGIANLNPARWTLTVNEAHPVDRAQYLRILIHEYMHLLTLADDQVERSWEQCATLQLMKAACAPTRRSSSSMTSSGRTTATRHQDPTALRSRRAGAPSSNTTATS